MSYPNPTYPPGHPYAPPYPQQHPNLAAHSPPVGFVPHQPYAYPSPSGAYPQPDFAPPPGPYPDPRLQGFPGSPYDGYAASSAPGNFGIPSPGSLPPPGHSPGFGAYSPYGPVQSPVPPPHLPPHISPPVGYVSPQAPGADNQPWIPSAYPTYPQPPPSVPTPAAPPAHTAPAPASTPKVTLRIPRPAPAPAPTTINPSDLDMSRHNPNPRGVAAFSSTDSFSSGRPTRRSAMQAQAQLSQINDDLPSDQDGEGEDEDDEHPIQAFTRSGRSSKPPKRYSGGDEDFEAKPSMSPPLGARRSSGRARGRIVDPDDEDEATQEDEIIEKAPPRKAFPTVRLTRSALHTSSAPEIGGGGAGPSFSNGAPENGTRNGRRERPATRKREKSRHSSADGDSFNPDESDGTPATNSALESDDPLEEPYAEQDSEDSFISHSPGSRRRQQRRPARASTRRAPARATRAAARRAQDSEEEYGGRRNLRERKQVNYELPPLDISTEITANVMQDAINAVSRPGGRAGGARGFAGGSRLLGASGKSMPWSLKGRDFSQAMGDPDTSDSDDMLTPGKPRADASGGLQAGGTGPRVTAPTDVPNFGRINPKSNTADADPLGVDMNVTFENVGGLDTHINQLKEMVALPLLYPELFQQFGITPPRGVLFHGPPGTGKTLLARALAASCSSGNTKIAFFMRKGADVLSKWVGEAERQLRMLFEEARAAQPSIIFFDEIDGLAPVRSSKQDQIHASLVSTLLALMDGMDGRGQVIVIGATNRPDAVDPALRRPGRFDREFYFPLPNRDARRKIIQINTRKWDPPLAPEVLERLAVLTKGYGGADLRALCTEAALNAIQRRYPQIYKSADRYALDAGSIRVGTKDFMMSVQKIVPSSARSTSSAAAQLPSHIVPLLEAPLERLKDAVNNVLPRHKPLTALQEAEFEDEGDEYEKAILLQSLDKLRTYRPRVLVAGDTGMGQTYLGPAILHHLEGFHVQSFDLGVLLGDSGRTVEAALVQLFVEAKRHQPSIIYIPSLSTWSTTLSDSAKSTFQALLESVPPSDPVLVLGVADGEVTWDVRDWFGWGEEEGVVSLESPGAAERTTYFAPLLTLLRRPPLEFPDAIPRRPRILENLPLAAPLPPREMTEAEIAREAARDQNAKTMMVISFITFVGELLKKYRKVVASVRMDAMELSQILADQAALAAEAAAADGAAAPPAEGGIAPAIIPGEAESLPLPNGNAGAGDISMTSAEPLPIPSASAPAAMEAQPLGPAPSPPLPSADVSIPPVADAPAAAIDAAGAAPAPAQAPAAEAAATTWQAHDIDIDTLHLKVVKNKYLTPSDFLADIALIEENAARLGDLERIGRIAEMAAQARFHVSGFDPKWTPEFEAYKERVMKRRVEKAKKKAKEAAAAGGAEGAEGAAGAEIAVGSGAAETINGEAAPAEIATATASAEAQVDGLNGKRQREEDGDVEMEDGIDAKRLRPDAETLPSSTNELVPSIPPPRAATPIVHPPFILSEPAVLSLGEALVEKTEGMSVEELEQLRAGLYDRIWKARASWDRTGLVRELGEWSGKYAEAVRARAEKGRREREELELEA